MTAVDVPAEVRDRMVLGLDVGGLDEAEAFRIMWAVHTQGVGCAGVYTYEIAEMKVERVTHMARAQEGVRLIGWLDAYEESSAGSQVVRIALREGLAQRLLADGEDQRDDREREVGPVEPRRHAHRISQPEARLDVACDLRRRLGSLRRDARLRHLPR